VTPLEHDTRLLELSRDLAIAQRRYNARQRAADRGVPSQYLPEVSVDPGAIQRVLTAFEEAGYTGWSRFRLVTSSSDGHLHADRCRTWKPKTVATIVPALSGKTAEEVTEQLGSVCCSVCLPSKTEARKVPPGLLTILIRKGTEEFLTALARRDKRHQDGVWGGMPPALAVGRDSPK
jgi:hypothetical protein